MTQQTQPPPMVSHGTRGTTAPDAGMGIIKLLLGLAALGFGGYLFYYNLDRAVRYGGEFSWGERAAKQDRSSGIILGVMLGFGLWMLVNGALQVKGRWPKWYVGLALMAVTIVVVAVGFPKAATASRAKSEQGIWAQLEASKKEYQDYKHYIDFTPLPPRKGVYTAAAQAQLKDEMAKDGKDAEGRVGRLRDMVYQFNRQMTTYNEPELKQPIGAAREALAATYARARADLDERLEKMPGKREFPEDQRMRDAFAAVLDRVARQENNHVHLAFSSDMKIPPTVPTPPGVSDLVQPGDAFSAERNDRRESTFRSALEGSLRDAFKDPLITIVPLKAGEDRTGKVVFQVHCVTKQAPGTFVLTRNEKPAGTLFSIEVNWVFTIFDADGKELVKHTARSLPASSFKFRFRREDPTSAAYGYMMDSTYYNYCREVTGRLGLIPPPVKEDFTSSR